MIPEEDVKYMLEYYGMIESEDSLESEMRENGVSWSDFAPAISWR